MCNVAQGTVLGPTLVNICVNYLAGSLTINHFICANDNKTDPPPLRNQTVTLQIAYGLSAEWKVRLEANYSN